MALSLVEILQRAGQVGQDEDRHSASQRRLTEALSGVGDLDIEGQLEDFAGGLFEQFFGAGGAVEDATSTALRSSVQTGFGPQSGGFTAARQNILSGARDEFGNILSQQAVNLAPLLLQQQESLFGGAATIENLGLAEEQMELNRRQIEAALQQAECGIGDRIGGAASGALGGAAAGSFVPGIGNVAGGIIGGLGGLFGGC